METSPAVRLKGYVLPTGWMSLVAWIAGTASAAFAFAYVLIIMVALSHEDGSISNAQTLGIIAGTLANSPKRVCGRLHLIISKMR